MNDDDDIVFFNADARRNSDLWICDRCGCLVYDKEAHLSMCPYQVKKINHDFTRHDPTKDTAA